MKTRAFTRDADPSGAMRDIQQLAGLGVLPTKMQTAQLANIINQMPIYIGTVANILASYPAAQFPGQSALATDLVQSSLIALYSNGLFWRPQGGSVGLLHVACPMLVPPSGTVNADGTSLTLAGALPYTTITSCWLYLPENTAGSGKPEGWYYAVMTSGTAGRLYQDQFDPLTSTDPSFPVVPTPCLSAANWTGISATPGNEGTTSGGEVLALRKTIKGGLLGNTGELQWDIRSEWTTGSESKITKVKFGNVILTAPSQTTNLGYRATHRLWNRGLPTLQWSEVSVADGASGSHNLSGQNIDTTADKTVDVTLTIGANTNNCALGLFLFNLRLVNV